MKNSIKLFVFVIIGALAINSCTYQDGPKLTLLPKKTRLCRQWVPDKTVDSNGNTSTATKDGSYVEFKKDGSVTTHDGTFNADFSGTWAWGDGKKDVILTYSSGGFSFSTTYEITRLTTKELQYKDGNGTVSYLDAK